LHERQEDLPLLVRAFVRRFSRELGKDLMRVTPEGAGVLRRYPCRATSQLQSVLNKRCAGRPGRYWCRIFCGRGSPSGKTGGTPVPSGGGDWEQFIQERLRAGSQDLQRRTLALWERSW